MRSKEIIKEAWPAIIGGTMAGVGALQAYKQQQAASAAQQPPQTAPAVSPAPVQPNPITAPVAKTTSPNFRKLQVSPKAQPLLQAAQAAGIKGTELAQFLAQMEHESWDFEKMQEVPKGKNYFNKYDPRHNPKLASDLGNKKAGDGQRYKGRGYIQLTGRTNYQMAGDYLRIDLINNPQLAADPKIAAKIAVWYWNTRVKPNVNNFNDTAAVTKYINPRLKGLEDRHQNFLNYMRQADPNWQYVPKR